MGLMGVGLVERPPGGCTVGSPEQAVFPTHCSALRPLSSSGGGGGGRPHVSRPAAHVHAWVWPLCILFVAVSLQHMEPAASEPLAPDLSIHNVHLASPLKLLLP